MQEKLGKDAPQRDNGIGLISSFVKGILVGRKEWISNSGRLYEASLPKLRATVGPHGSSVLVAVK